MINEIVIARGILTLFGFFLFAAGVVMLTNPPFFKRTVAKVGSTAHIHCGEHLIRMIPGFAFIVYSQSMTDPTIFRVIGWFLVGSSMIILFLPRRWHNQYAVKASEMLTPIYLKIAAVFIFIVSCVLVFKVTLPF